ncbi:MAG: hypothetical protein H6900_04730 [Rhodobacter sp.]|uniref:hypothetical protein n=1 Tax=Pararhodobacter sp. TaxID=2127056 RepID=UPI001D3B968B|nr:hypothetical protein [Pararhodobacter sp.]MCB1346968.1 hypothetical protein [Paracoccaceae bacterium]MCC0072579.1 hypothetical protein [Rhodobacter sp.]HPD94046.1 hypothetical protein [Pararhodobacter sp.]
MSKHPLDHDHGASGSKMAKFAEIERGKQPAQATKDLQQRERAKGDAKLKAYSKIERTGSAE